MDEHETRRAKIALMPFVSKIWVKGLFRFLEGKRGQENEPSPKLGRADFQQDISLLIRFETDGYLIFFTHIDPQDRKPWKITFRLARNDKSDQHVLPVKMEPKIETKRIGGMMRTLLHVWPCTPDIRARSFTFIS